MEIKSHKDSFEIKIPKMLSKNIISAPWGNDLDYVHSKPFFLFYDGFDSGRIKHQEWVKKVKFSYSDYII